MIDAAKRASAKTVIAVMPYFGWARQDRKDKPRVSIAAKLVADMLTAAGVDRVITMDLHADQIQGFFNVPLDHLYASSVFIPYIQSLNLEDMLLLRPHQAPGSRLHSPASSRLHPGCRRGRPVPGEGSAVIFLPFEKQPVSPF